MENEIYSYENVKNKIAESGLTNVFNEMFGCHLTCDRAVMFGEKPVDDDLLYEIGNTVCLAVKSGKLTKDELQAVMAPVYELHSKVNNDRFDRMANKGRHIACKILSDDKMRNDIDKFKREWGDGYTFVASEFPIYGKKRRRTVPDIQNNLLPNMFEVCGVYPKLQIETEGPAGQYAFTKYSIKQGDFSQCIELFLDDESCAFQTATGLLATIAHELHHCSQNARFYRIRTKTPEDYWCVSPTTGKIPQEVVWERASSVDYFVANRRNPLEQEAYTVESAFEYCLNKYYKTDGKSKKKAVIAALKKPCDEEMKNGIDNILLKKYNSLREINYCTESMRYR